MDRTDGRKAWYTCTESLCQRLGLPKYSPRCAGAMLGTWAYVWRHSHDASNTSLALELFQAGALDGSIMTWHDPTHAAAALTALTRQAAEMIHAGENSAHLSFQKVPPRRRHSRAGSFAGSFADSFAGLSAESRAVARYRSSRIVPPLSRAVWLIGTLGHGLHGKLDIATSRSETVGCECCGSCATPMAPRALPPSVGAARANGTRSDGALGGRAGLLRDARRGCPVASVGADVRYMTEASAGLPVPWWASELCAQYGRVCGYVLRSAIGLSRIGRSTLALASTNDGLPSCMVHGPTVHADAHTHTV